MAEGIHYTEPAYPGAGQKVFVGARSGLSLDAGGYVILGEALGASGSPAALLADQEVPFSGYSLNFFDGSLVVSPSAQAAMGDSLVQIIRNEIGTDNDQLSLLLLNTTAATSSLNQYSPGILLSGQTWDGSESQLAAFIIQAESDGLTVKSIVGAGSPETQLTVSSSGQIVGGLFQGVSFLATSGGYQFEVGSDFYALEMDAGELGDGVLYLFATAGTDQSVAIACANMDDSVNREYFILGFTQETNMLTLVVGAQGTGVVRPVAFLPPIRYGDTTPPTAQVDITPGTAALGPLRLNAGTNVTTPVNGLFEYDGTNLYFTVGSTRKTVTLI